MVAIPQNIYMKKNIFFSFFFLSFILSLFYLFYFHSFFFCVGICDWNQAHVFSLYTYKLCPYILVVYFQSFTQLEFSSVYLCVNFVCGGIYCRWFSIYGKETTVYSPEFPALYFNSIHIEHSTIEMVFWYILWLYVYVYHSLP